ncbi:hypothetical protein NQZ68_027777 [Dissostichus eleginoides]|nr:hypothetical protein NQZ68_027777 [Dissostichus eleginoides]
MVIAPPAATDMKFQSYNLEMQTEPKINKQQKCVTAALDCPCPSSRMNSIRQVPTRVKSRRTEANLGAEREHFDKQQHV